MNDADINIRNYLEQILFQCHFSHHKCHFDWSRIELVSSCERPVTNWFSVTRKWKCFFVQLSSISQRWLLLFLKRHCLLLLLLILLLLIGMYLGWKWAGAWFSNINRKNYFAEEGLKACLSYILNGPAAWYRVISSIIKLLLIWKHIAP